MNQEPLLTGRKPASHNNSKVVISVSEFTIQQRDNDNDEGEFKRDSDDDSLDFEATKSIKKYTQSKFKPGDMSSSSFQSENIESERNSPAATKSVSSFIRNNIEEDHSS